MIWRGVHVQAVAGSTSRTTKWEGKFYLIRDRCRSHHRHIHLGARRQVPVHLWCRAKPSHRAGRELSDNQRPKTTRLSPRCRTRPSRIEPAMP